MADLKTKFHEELSLKLQKELNLQNRMSVPKMLKIVLNIGVKEALVDKKNLDEASRSLARLCGQKPKITRAKTGIASFKLRKGDAIGIAVTIRGKRMYDFFEKLVTIVLPRFRDFRGVPKTGFDGRGNYTLGIREISVFPEIETASMLGTRGLEMTIVTSAKNDKEGEALLTKLGMPFRA